MSPATLIRALRRCAALRACLENDSSGAPCRRELMCARLADKIEKRLFKMLEDVYFTKLIAEKFKKAEKQLRNNATDAMLYGFGTSYKLNGKVNK